MDAQSDAGTPKMADNSGPPTASSSSFSVGRFISSQIPGFLGWGSSWRWWGSWRVWPHRPVVAGYLKCRSRRTERPGALMRLRRRCHGDCWPCCRLGCRLGWWDRWLWTPLAWDLTGEKRETRKKKTVKMCWQKQSMHLCRFTFSLQHCGCGGCHVCGLAKTTDWIYKIDAASLMSPSGLWIFFDLQPQLSSSWLFVGSE